MLHLSNISELSLPNCWLTIGVYDGVHAGHQSILQKLVDGAHAENLPAVVLTFHPHPATVLSAQPVPLLTLPEERAEQFAALGVDFVVTQAFDRPLAATSAEEFMAQLKEHLGLTTLLVGYDFALGRGRAGTPERLAQIGNGMHFRVEVVPAVENAGEVYSSTSIRTALLEGNIQKANQKLGRIYSLRGKVMHGDGRGGKIGIHTANIEPDVQKCVPANGVYACRVRVDDAWHDAVTNIGTRPTFTDARTTHIEAHLLDFSADLYGQTLEVQFVARLRGEQKFDGLEAILTQIRADIAQARQILQ
jgi:riboflavin kinase / FMN adenylyltransferase